jgi:hypothetical protein
LSEVVAKQANRHDARPHDASHFLASPKRRAKKTLLDP